MNKNDLISVVAVKSGQSRATAALVVDAAFSSIVDALSQGEDVRIIGFGTFSVAHRAASKGRNPRTNEVIDVPASKQPKFKAGRTLKDAVN